MIPLLRRALKVAESLPETTRRIASDTVRERFQRHKKLAAGSKAAEEAFREGWDDVASLQQLRDRRIRERSRQRSPNTDCFGSEYKRCAESRPVSETQIKLRWPVSQDEEMGILGRFGIVSGVKRVSDSVVVATFANTNDKQLFLERFPRVLPE